MFKKLDFILQKYDELSMMVADPTIISEQQKWQKLMREMSDMEPVVIKYKEYKKAETDKASTLEMLEESGLDEDMDFIICIFCENVVHIVSIEIPTADVAFKVKVVVLFRHKNSVLM